MTHNMTKDMVAFQEDRIKNNLLRAIATIRAACDEAERSINGDSPERAAQRTLHSISWGYANASSSIQSAMHAIEDMHCMIESDLKEQLSERDNKS